MWYNNYNVVRSVNKLLFSVKKKVSLQWKKSVKVGLDRFELWHESLEDTKLNRLATRTVVFLYGFCFDKNIFGNNSTTKVELKKLEISWSRYFCSICWLFGWEYSCLHSRPIKSHTFWVPSYTHAYATLHTVQITANSANECKEWGGADSRQLVVCTQVKKAPSAHAH